MKAKDLVNKSVKELDKDLAEHREKLATAIMELRSREVTNVRQIRQLKKNVARLLTVLTQKEMEQINE